MPNIILGCTIWAVALYAVTSVMGLGWIHVTNETHRLAGIFTAVFAIATQGLAFTLGIAWARIITEASKADVLPRELGNQARVAMMRIDGAAMLAMSAVVAAAVMGGAADTGSTSPAAHGWASAVALAVLVGAFVWQYRDFAALKALFERARATLEAAAREAEQADGRQGIDRRRRSSDVNGRT